MLCERITAYAETEDDNGGGDADGEQGVQKGRDDVHSVHHIGLRERFE